jgi:epsilon-lactone hydrolase
MPSKQSEAVRRRWEAARLAMTQADGEGPDDESWGDLTAEPPTTGTGRVPTRRSASRS